MGMKGGCSPQNTLRLKHSLWRRKLNIRKFYEVPIAPSAHGTTPNIARFVGRSANCFRGSFDRILLVRKSWKPSPSQATPASFSISVTTRSNSSINALSPCLRKAMTNER